MRFALLNPNWSFEGSIYFGCREPHLPLEFGYSKALLERAGHEVMLLDAQMGDLLDKNICDILRGFRPDLTVVATAPSYLFWRCPPPELTIPRRLVRAIRPFVDAAKSGLSAMSRDLLELLAVPWCRARGPGRRLIHGRACPAR